MTETDSGRGFRPRVLDFYVKRDEALTFVLAALVLVMVGAAATTTGSSRRF